MPSSRFTRPSSPTTTPDDPNTVTVFPGVPATITVTPMVRPAFRYDDGSPAKEVFLYALEFKGPTATSKGIRWLGADAKPFDANDKAKQKGLPPGKYYFYCEKELFEEELVGALSKEALLEKILPYLDW